MVDDVPLASVVGSEIDGDVWPGSSVPPPPETGVELDDLKVLSFLRIRRSIGYDMERSVDADARYE